MTGSTLRRFLTLDAQLDPNLIFLLEDVAGACRAIADHIRNSAFEGNQGATDSTNVQGEAQKPLDIIANDEFMRICANSPRLAALVSEEVDDVTWLKEPEAGDYILYFDPLDGSSNLDLNLSVGSIFSVMQVRTDGDRDVLRKGADQLCAGYSVYGPSTMLVLAIGHGVQGFSLQSGTGEFRLTHPQMRVPEESTEFAINISRARHWEQPVRRYVDECLLGPDGARGKSFNMRWVASMVAEVHRILTRGGVFMYPIDDEIRAAGGRLRLMYEANPMGMVIEAAGGMASTGRARILDLPPEGHHQRVPVILGSKAEVERIVRYHSEDDARK
ncbi:MAG: class 1 fructose-bisphosphatase [Maritimibacter sp.]